MDKDYENDDYDKVGSYNYDDEISRKAVGKLLDGLDEDEHKFSKPVVRAASADDLDDKKIESINTDFYDEDRAKLESADDGFIVKGFHDEDLAREIEAEDGGFTGDVSEVRAHDYDLEGTRPKRTRVLTSEQSDDRQERERYRRQFMEGYTDVRRKGLDMTQTGEPRKRPPSDDTTRRQTAPRSIEGAARRPRPAEDDFKLQQKPIRARRPKDIDEEITIIPRRPERRPERSPQTGTSAISLDRETPFSAPIFKILAGVFALLLILIIVLVVQINGANKKVDELTKKNAEIQTDTQALATLNTENETLKQQVNELKDTNNTLQIRVGELETMIAQQSSPPPVESNPTQTTGTSSGNNSYTVVSGDSLSKISTKFYGNTSGVSKIKQANNLSSDNINVGQVLIIPQ